MSRRTRAIKHAVAPDYKYGDILVTQFISRLMRCGKRSTAERCLYSALETLEKKSGQNALEAFRKAVYNVKPVLEVRSRRVGGATYQVPVEVRPERRTALAIKWIKGYAMARSGKTMSEKLAAELLAAGNSEGGAIKKKEDTHKMAEANKAFAHFKW